VRDASSAALQAVPDVGPTVAAAIRDFFETEATSAGIDRLLEHVDPQEADINTEEASAFEGVTVVFTGSLDQFTRGEAQDLVERHGGSATSSVSGSTDYLVVGDNPGQTKRDGADTEGVPMVDESAFLELLDEAGVEY